MRDEEQRALEIEEHALELLPGCEIEMVRRLVEDEEIRVACGEPRESESAALAAREHADLLEHVVAAEEEAGEQVAGRRFVEAAGAAERIEHGLVARELALRLCEEGDARRRRGAEVALQGREVADDRPDERRLPRAVRTDHRDPRAARDPERAGAHDRVVVPDRQRRRIHDRIACEVGGLEPPAMARTRLGRRDALDARELLRAAARLLRALARAVAADEFLRAGDLFGLARRRLLRGRLALRALARVRGVGAAVLDDALALERQRPRGDAIEEPAVVRYDQERLVSALEEEPFEPFERRDVEMIGRLVEQEKVRVVEEKAREPETRPLATGERAHVTI